MRMKRFEITALGLENLSRKEAAINGGNILGQPGPTGFDPAEVWGDPFKGIAEALGDAYDWVKGFIHGLLS